jgi:molybdopterin/thiamine biosynthesis adenylyltransferase
MGGVGGGHVLTLSRLGLTKFNLSDFDEFELPNFNRQVGATISQLNRPKLDVLSEMAIDINPEIQCNTFPSGVNSENLHQFLEGVDLYVDALDFFALETRRAVFQACAEKEIPAITAAPLGMGVAFLCFMPGGMTFEEYFQLEGYSEDEKLLRFLLGLSPSMLQASYLADKTRVDLAAHKGPSTMMACDLCAGVAGTMALKVLLGRGKVPVAPKGLHFDAYRNKMKMTWRPWGNRNPVQKLGLLIARKKLGSQLSKSP